MKKLLLTTVLLLSSVILFAQENLYVAVDNGNQVYYINKAGKVVFKMDTTGAAISDFKNYKNGYLIVDYTKAGKLAVFDSRGKRFSRQIPLRWRIPGILNPLIIILPLYIQEQECVQKRA